jgi:hypothetical protein
MDASERFWWSSEELAMHEIDQSSQSGVLTTVFAISLRGELMMLGASKVNM